MNELRKFNYDSLPIRGTVINNQTWWVASDICSVLNLSNPSESLRALDADEKSTLRVSEGGPERNIISEAGLYSLILRSNKPEAKAFKRWITHEVIPSIRKNGMYAKNELLDDPDLLLEVVTKLKHERDLRMAAENKNILNAPKVLFADSVGESGSTILISDMAKLLKQNGIDTGGVRFYAWLRENGYLIKRPGQDFNMPTQRSMELGLFKIKETPIVHADKPPMISKTTKVTGKGQQYFIAKFLSER